MPTRAIPMIGTFNDGGAGAATKSGASGASRASPVVVPTQRLSPTASRLSTTTPRLPIAVALPSPPTTASPRDVPTHTPSGAGATLVTSSDGSPRPTSYSRLR